MTLHPDLPDLEAALGNAQGELQQQILSLTSSDTKTHDLKLMYFTLGRVLEFCTDPRAETIKLT